MSYFINVKISLLLGRKQALEHLRKAGNSNPDDIRRLESGCKVVWTEDDPTLPPGKIS